MDNDIGKKTGNDGRDDDRTSPERVLQSLTKFENERIEVITNINTINQELGYLRHIIDFQNQKIEKLTSLITELLENKDLINIINSVQALQDVSSHDDQVNQLQEKVQRQLENLVSDQVVHLMDNNMDPELSEVAQAAVQAQNVDGLHFQRKKPLKRDHKDNGVNVPQVLGPVRKKPKIVVDFLHNPMTVQEIYDEFTKGFRGQPPLKEMDQRYGKHEWRGDSRSKESKRFQRRKKLCDAIDKGAIKFNESTENIIRRIEEFRGNKSLTWVMNGHLPAELE